MIKLHQRLDYSILEKKIERNHEKVHATANNTPTKNVN